MKQFGMYSEFYVNTKKTATKHICVGFVKVEGVHKVLSDQGTLFELSFIESLVSGNQVSHV